MKRPLMVIVLCLALSKHALALNWIIFHEQADMINPRGALLAYETKLNPLDKMYLLALVYLNQHKDSDAGNIFEGMLALDKDSKEAKWGKAEVLRRRHKIKESKIILDQVISSDRAFAPAYISLAYIKYIEKDFEGAARLALKVIRLGSSRVDLSNYTRAYLIYSGSKGMIANFGGPISKALNGVSVLPNLMRAQKMQPDSAAVKFGLGSFYLLAPQVVGGDLRKAGRYLKEAISIDSYLADAYARYAQYYQLKGEKKNYEAYLNKALEVDPQNELALDIKSGKCDFICVGK